MISVVIPTIGRRFGLERAVWSVIVQNVDQIEVVIVNDSDYEIEESLHSKFGDLCDLKVIRSSGRNPSVSRNIGINAATREFITFLDDDDIILPGRLNKFLQEKSLLEVDYGFLTTNRVYVNEHCDFLRASKLTVGPVNLDDIIQANKIDISIFCRLDFIRTLNGFDEAMKGFEDWDLIVRMLCIKPGYRLSGSDLVVFEHKIDLRVSDRQLLGLIYFANKHKEIMGPKIYSETISLGLYHTNALSIPVAARLAISAKIFYPILLALKQKVKNIIRRWRPGVN